MSYPIIRQHEEIISKDTRHRISIRYHKVTSAINREFYGIESDSQHCLYVGSYGRGTAIDASDIDILVELPLEKYSLYNDVDGNGQSRLLQAVRSAIKKIYTKSAVQADGQVVKIAFSDGMLFEILPAFRNQNGLGRLFDIWDGTYKYPNTNNGGRWLVTNPKAEQTAMRKKNVNSNGLLFDTCKHFRRVKQYLCVDTLPGDVIDSFVYGAIGSWKWQHSRDVADATHGEYALVLLNHFNSSFRKSLLAKMWSGISLSAPGSERQVDINDDVINCLERVVRYITE